MSHDTLGNPISQCRPETAAAIDDFVLGFLGYDLRIVNVLAAAEDNAESTLLNAYAGLLWMLSETGGTPNQAKQYLARAEKAEAEALPRERDIVHVLRLWIADDLPGSLHQIEQILQVHPCDLAMLKLHQYHSFNTGDFPAMLRVAIASQKVAGDVAYLHGMLAFAYEQLHLLDKAEGAGRHALALQPREPWAQHALAHVMLTQGRIGEGVAFLESKRDSWGGLTSFMYTHLWWHLALFYLSQGRFKEALAAYDDHCWSQQKDFSQDQIGAVSLLARFAFAGIDVGARWSDLGPYLAARQDDVSQPFLTLQYFYGLARAGRPEASHLLAAIRRAPSDGPQASREVWRSVGVPLAEGLAAHAAGDHEAALQLIEPKLGQLMDIGGSHAQRDLFDQIVLDTLLQTRRFKRAQQILETRRLSDRDGVPVNRELARVYRELGLPLSAAEAQERVEAAG